MSNIVTIPERVWQGPGPDRWVYHLPQGDWDAEAWFQPVVCGGGIALPYRKTVDRSEVCPNCLAGRVTRV